MQRSYNQMDNNEVVTEEVAAVVENNTGIENIRVHALHQVWQG